MFLSKNTYAKNEVTTWPIPNYWDAIALVIVLAIIILLGWSAKAVVGKFQLGQVIPISLNPDMLPYYALRTVFRLFIALGCSLVFTFIFGTWAAKSRQAERIIIPMIDILQSVPVLGFLTITIMGFIALFPGSMLGPECAAIFAIFTAQVWNMTLSFYQSVRSVPQDLQEAAAILQLSAWQRFWRIDVPFATPGLLWNMMMSMSGSWVFLVASEAISVANQHITLPGIGSYLAKAIETANSDAIGYVIVTMFIVIALYDQLFFRPLVAWGEKFKKETNVGDDLPESWLLNLFHRTRFFRFIGQGFALVSDAIINFKLFRLRATRKRIQPNTALRRAAVFLWNIILGIAVVVAAMIIYRYVFATVSLGEGAHVLYLGFLTALRVTVVIIISSLVWVPIGIGVGLHPKASRIVQPVAQFLAAFPVNLLFPLVVIVILRYGLDVNVWTSPLMILGTQWYILFNVIAGTISLPKNLHHAVGTLNVKGWLWWKRFALPGIFPYYITGAITAAGGAWNISIIAEAVSWGHTHLYASGIGAYIAKVSAVGDFPRLVLGIAVMSLYVFALNRLMWRPLYNLAVERFQIR
ncbi:ABC transporter permease [Candidiatus Paracoxiella cheracis]|uniref:ABC transporter permease n=1 Tax=Candidiatus Paracoxiella cheracis TaxID=3405120 RepID=UPI003BF5F8A6